MTEHVRTRGMKPRTIRKVINAKIDEWLETIPIEESEVISAIKKDLIVTGGCIASMLLGEKINDFDAYFRTKESAAIVARYYVKKFDWKTVIPAEIVVPSDENRVRIIIASIGSYGSGEGDHPDAGEEEDTLGEYEFADDETLEKYRPVFFSENAITLSNKIQLVTRFCGSPDEIHGNYDFVHAMNYFDYAKQELVLKPEALECLLSKTLIYRGSLYPICSLFRMRKFIDRGWKISAGEILKISWQIHELKLKELSVLREQLTGVDYLYFSELVKALEEADARGELNTERFTSNYVNEIIDRIFNR